MSRSRRKTAVLALLLGGLVVSPFGLQAFAPSVTPSGAFESGSSTSATERVPSPRVASKPASANEDTPAQARSEDPLFDLDVTPHPPSKHAERDARQHELFAALSLALEKLDFPRARRLLAEHSRAFPEGGWQDQRRGFELVLGCLEHPEERGRLTSDAESYLNEERISPLRRAVRRVCLEGRGYRRRT